MTYWTGIRVSARWLTSVILIVIELLYQLIFHLQDDSRCNINTMVNQYQYPETEGGQAPQRTTTQ